MLSKNQETQISKFLSFVLRHKPETISLHLDNEGWVNVLELLDKSKKEITFTFQDLEQVVENNNKKRFEFSSDKTKIRVQQGHSVEVNLNLPFVEPPSKLFHGTAKQFLNSIMASGLKPMNRHDVHLSTNADTASQVGSRHGKLVMLEINSHQMFLDGFKFQCTNNNVWLTQHVPVKYINVKN